MHSLNEYLEKLSTTQLQALLREECEGRGSLPVEAVLSICEVLAERKPQYPAVEDVILRLCRIYLE